MQRLKTKKVKITEGRVNLILDNLELPAEELNELTDGLTVKIIELIKRLELEGKRGIKSVN